MFEEIKQENRKISEGAAPLPRRKYRRKVVFSLVIIFLIVIVTALTLFTFGYRDSDSNVKEYVAQVAGEAVVRAAKSTNPTKSEKRYYSALIMGIDTRGVEFNGEEYLPVKSDGTRKIDVIMQVLYDRETKKLTFISIPRDTSLPVTEECMHQEREDQKYINRIYDMAEKNDCPQSGPEMMMKYVSYITGYDIDHYAIVTLDSFVDLISIVGEDDDGEKGLWLDIPEAVSDYCPNKYYGYDYVYYPKGRQFLTPDKVLCYVRVRKTSNDFVRNRRQQMLVNEVSKLILSSKTLKSPVKLMQIYQSMQSEMQMSAISFKDISMGIEIMDEIDIDNIQKIVLDYEFGSTNALLTKPSYSPPGTHTRSGYYLIPTAWEDECCKVDEWKLVREYLHRLVEDPEASTKQASIYAYVNSNYNIQGIEELNAYQDLSTKAQDELLIINTSKYTLPTLTSGPDVQIFDFSNGEKRLTAAMLANMTGGKVYDGSNAPFKRVNNEEIAVVFRVSP